MKKYLKTLIWIIAVTVASYLFIRFLAHPQPVKSAESSVPLPPAVFPAPPGHPPIDASGHIKPRLDNPRFQADHRTTEEFTPNGYFRPGDLRATTNR